MGVVVVHNVVCSKDDGWAYDSLAKTLYRNNPGRGSQFISNKQQRILTVLREERERLIQAATDIGELIQIILEDTE